MLKCGGEGVHVIGMDVVSVFQEALCIDAG